MLYRSHTLSMQTRSFLVGIYTGGSFIFKTAQELWSYKIFHCFIGSTGKGIEKKDWHWRRMQEKERILI